MKKLTIITIISLIIISCSYEPDFKTNVKEYAEVTSEFKSTVKRFLESPDFSSGRKKTGDVSFDVDNMQAVAIEGNGDIYAIVANADNYSEENIENLSLGFIAIGDTISSVLIVRTTNNLDNTRLIEYLDLEGSIFYSTLIDFETGATTTTFLQENANGRNMRCNGQDVADCIDHAYTGMGWFSVGLFVVTVLEPGVGLGVAGGCAAACLASREGTTIKGINGVTIISSSPVKTYPKLVL